MNFTISDDLKQEKDLIQRLKDFGKKYGLDISIGFVTNLYQKGDEIIVFDFEKNQSRVVSELNYFFYLNDSITSVDTVLQSVKEHLNLE